MGGRRCGCGRCRRRAGVRPKASPSGLADEHVTGLYSSPYVRCVQTLEPLAKRLGLTVVADERLAEGSSLDRQPGAAGRGRPGCGPVQPRRRDPRPARRAGSPRRRAAHGAGLAQGRDVGAHRRRRRRRRDRRRCGRAAAGRRLPAEVLTSRWHRGRALLAARPSSPRSSSVTPTEFGRLAGRQPRHRARAVDGAATSVMFPIAGCSGRTPSWRRCGSGGSTARRNGSTTTPAVSAGRPAGAGSIWSAINIATVERLIAEGRMEPAGTGGVRSPPRRPVRRLRLRTGRGRVAAGGRRPLGRERGRAGVLGRRHPQLPQAGVALGHLGEADRHAGAPARPVDRVLRHRRSSSPPSATAPPPRWLEPPPQPPRQPPLPDGLPSSSTGDARVSPVRDSCDTGVLGGTGDTRLGGRSVVVGIRSGGGVEGGGELFDHGPGRGGGVEVEAGVGFGSARWRCPRRRGRR